MVWILLGLLILGCVVWEIARRSSRKVDLVALRQAVPGTLRDPQSPIQGEPRICSSSPRPFAINVATSATSVAAVQESAPLLTDANNPDEYAFIDLETTGLDSQRDRIIEVGVLIFKERDQKQEGYSELVYPDRKLPARIIELTGITDEMLSDAGKASEVIPKFLDYIGERTLFTYNAEFDIGFLKAEAKRLGREFNNPSHCIMEYFKRAFPQLPSHSLDAVCQAFEITIDKDSHRAGADAERAMRVFLAAFYGKQPKQIASDSIGNGYANRDNIYYVYGHYNSSETLFYVGVGNGDRAWSKELSPIWKWYVDKTLGGKYTVKLLRENLHGWDAGDYKDSLLKLHSHTLLNRQNPHRETDYSQLAKFHVLRDANRNQIKKARSLEKTDPETAIRLLKSSIERLEEYSFTKLESGYFGQVIDDMVQEHGSKGELEALDRLTLLLCKQGQALEAKKITEQYFTKFKADQQLKKAEAVYKRVDKAASSAPA